MPHGEVPTAPIGHMAALAYDEKVKSRRQSRVQHAALTCVCVCVSVGESVCVCVRAYVRACVCVCVSGRV